MTPNTPVTTLSNPYQGTAQNIGQDYTWSDSRTDWSDIDWEWGGGQTVVPLDNPVTTL